MTSIQSIPALSAPLPSTPDSVPVHPLAVPASGESIEPAKTLPTNLSASEEQVATGETSSGIGNGSGVTVTAGSQTGENMGTKTPPIPMVHLRVLVISGQYHLFSFEPETTVGRVKELIWSMWPSEWTSPSQPPSPNFLRVLYSGRILQDDSTLGSNNLPAALTPVSPTVIHLSVRSFSIRAEEDPKKPAFIRAASAVRTSRNAAGGRSQDDDHVGGCKCVIM